MDKDKLETYKINLFFLSIHGKLPNFKELLYFSKYLLRFSEKEMFNEIILKLESEMKISLDLSVQEKMSYLNDAKSRSVPKNVYMTLKTFDELNKNSEIHYVKKDWDDLIDVNVVRYNDIECRHMLIDNFSEQIVNAYDKLVPGAYKSDLWRLCVLFLYGGIYSDVHIRPNLSKDTSSVLDAADYIFCIDFPSSPKYIYNAMMKAPKGSKLLMSLINKIVSNVEKKVYPKSDLGISGPKLHGDVILDYLNIVNFEEGYVEFDDELFLFISHKRKYVKGFEYTISLDDTDLFYCRYKGYKNELSLICKNEHYSTLFKKKQVYKY